MAKTLVYQLYPITWESKGGIEAMTEHLQHVIHFLRVDYVWVSPLYPSPRYDHGYDVADYKAIDERFGTMEDFDKFVKAAHDLDIGVLMDLVLNHTSTNHPWFREHPEYYYWADTEQRNDWQNLFDEGSVWEYDEAKEQYYLHLFHPKQADLRWYDDESGEINYELVREFRDIVDFWVNEHHVDGFRLDAIQTIDKEIGNESELLDQFFEVEKSPGVLNAIFCGGGTQKSYEDLFLMLECFDPTYRDVADSYATKTPYVNFVTNIFLKDAYPSLTYVEFRKLIDNQCGCPNYMLELESHDAPRFPSRGLESEAVIELMFNSDARGICLYQGQELGLYNPNRYELPDEKLLEMDAQTAMRYEKGECLEELRPISRANARVPISTNRYVPQAFDDKSVLNLTRDMIRVWKNRE